MPTESSAVESTKKPNKAKKVASICGITLLLLIFVVLFINALLSVFIDRYYPTFGNYRLFAIVSDSMEPEIPTGDMIVSSVPKSKNDIKVGSVITYEIKQGNNITLITHRVTEVITDDKGNVSYTTRGDNVDKADTIHPEYSDVVGVWTGKQCGFFGYFFGFLQSAEGAITLILIAFVIAVAVIIIHFVNIISVWRKAAATALQKSGDLIAGREDEDLNTIVDVLSMVVKEPRNKTDVKRKDKKLRWFVKTGNLPKRPYHDDLDENELEHITTVDDDKAQPEILLDEHADTPPVNETPVQEENVAQVPEQTEEVAAAASVPVEVVTESYEQIRYKYTMCARLAQLKPQTKDWYSDIKNELLSYAKIKCRTSNRYETFMFGRKGVARLAVRGKTLCLFFAADPAKYEGTKYSVQKGNAAMPSVYKLKSQMRVKYAIELIAELMQELGTIKDANYEAQDFYTPYEGVVSLMKKGLVKRTVGNKKKTYKIEEVTEEDLAQDGK